MTLVLTKLLSSLKLRMTPKEAFKEIRNEKILESPESIRNHPEYDLDNFVLMSIILDAKNYY